MCYSYLGSAGVLFLRVHQLYVNTVAIMHSRKYSLFVSKNKDLVGLVDGEYKSCTQVPWRRSRPVLDDCDWSSRSRLITSVVYSSLSLTHSICACAVTWPAKPRTCWCRRLPQSFRSALLLGTMLRLLARSLHFPLVFSRPFVGRRKSHY